MPNRVNSIINKDYTGNKDYILMHQRIAVAKIKLDEVSGAITKIADVYNPEHLPVGIALKHGRPDRSSFNEWWIDRSIPASRSGIRKALETLEISSTKTLLVRCFGLSLSDQYWVCPADSNLTWDQLNFFDNPFSDDIGDVLFGRNKNVRMMDFTSPDSTSDGNLKKRWKILNGKRCLIKGGSNPYRQQPFNEVIASHIMHRLDIPHIPYNILWDDGSPYSVCEDFVTADMDLVPAWRIIQIKKKPNNISLYQHFVDCAKSLEIPNIVHFLNQMITLDYIIANEDRHLNNFGALRNAVTLEWAGMAPIYDSGSSLGYDKVAYEIRHGHDVICKPFKNHHEEQLKLVTDFSWIDFQNLSDVDELITNTLSVQEAKKYMDDARITAIVDTTKHRIQRVKEHSKKTITSQTDSTKDDVIKNIAKEY